MVKCDVYICPKVVLNFKKLVNSPFNYFDMTVSCTQKAFKESLTILKKLTDKKTFK